MLHLPTTVDAVRAALDNGDYAALSDLMEFDSPITVHEDGTITKGPEGRDGWAPELWDGELDSDRWSLMDGYSGQYSYAGPVMHASEFIGGRMARDILDEPGTYVAIVAQSMCETCGASGIVFVTDDAGVDSEASCPDCEAPGYTVEGWAIARLNDPLRAAWATITEGQHFHVNTWKC